MEARQRLSHREGGQGWCLSELLLNLGPPGRVSSVGAQESLSDLICTPLPSDGDLLAPCNTRATTDTQRLKCSAVHTAWQWWLMPVRALLYGLNICVPRPRHQIRMLKT